MDTSIKTQALLTSVQKFDCPSCGSSLQVLHPRAKYVACNYCGSMLDLNSETHTILKKLGEPKRHHPMSFIKLGQEMSLGGKKYQVIARTRWKMKYKEYWSEDGESGYSNEIWTYDEWLLLADNYTYFYLIEDREGYAISEEIIPELPELRPKDLKMRFFKNQRKKRVQEYGSANAIFFEGESNYMIRPGDQINFTMFSDRGIDYLSEWRADSASKEIKEVEFFKETPISRRRLVDAFANNPEIGKMKEKEDEWRFYFKTFRLTFLAMLILFLVSMFYPGRQIFTQQFSLNNIQDSVSSAMITRPIEAGGKGLYRLKLEASGMPENTEMYAFAYILDQDKLAINKVDGEFYYYAGYDSDGRWEEADRKSAKYFKLKEAGTYYLQLYVSSEFANMGNIEVKVYKGIWLSRYFFIALFLLLFPLAISYMKKEGWK